MSTQISKAIFCLGQKLSHCKYIRKGSKLPLDRNSTNPAPSHPPTPQHFPSPHPSLLQQGHITLRQKCSRSSLSPSTASALPSPGCKGEWKTLRFRPSSKCTLGQNINIPTNVRTIRLLQVGPVDEVMRASYGSD